jgi:hypothetical protein
MTLLRQEADRVPGRPIALVGAGVLVAIALAAAVTVVLDLVDAAPSAVGYPAMRGAGAPR